MSLTYYQLSTTIFEEIIGLFFGKRQENYYRKDDKG